MKALFAAVVLIVGVIGPTLAHDRIRISSDWREVIADLADNHAAKTLAGMLPLRVEMTDDLRQERTGNLPAALPELPRQRDFSVGTLGLWSTNHIVIYYRGSSVSSPGIIVLGQVTGDVAIFDRPGPVTVRIEPAGR